MNYLKDIISNHPSKVYIDEGDLSNCIDALYYCSQANIACADACLSEEMVKDLAKCIKLNLDCADICSAAGRTLSRIGFADMNYLSQVLDSCITACRLCGDECNRHSRMEHCSICADACKNTENICRSTLESISAMV
jgi:hypothetical protein